jgi:hypothetical protein
MLYHDGCLHTLNIDNCQTLKKKGADVIARKKLSPNALGFNEN